MNQLVSKISLTLFLLVVKTGMVTEFNSFQSVEQRATGWTTPSIPGSSKICIFSTAPKPALRLTHPPLQWVREVNFSGVKQQGREADHSPPSSTEVKNGGGIPPLPHISLWHYA
jgi:hypothetical protein